MSHRGIPALLRRLRGGTPAQQVAAATALRRLTLQDGPARDAAAAAMAAAGAMPLLLRLAGTSLSSELLTPVAFLLANLAYGSPQQAEAMAAAGGVPLLLRLMQRSDSDELQRGAGVALLNVTAVSQGTAAAAAAAGAIDVMVQLLSSSRRGSGVLAYANDILTTLAKDSPRRAQAIVSAGAVPPLVQLMGSDSMEHQLGASQTLTETTAQRGSGGNETSAAVEAAGGIAACIQLLSSSNSRIAESAATLLRNMALRSPSRQQGIHAAGGLSALVSCVRRSSTEAVQDEAAAAALPHVVLATLMVLATDSPERCQAIADASGPCVCAGILARPISTECKGLAAAVAGCLARHGQSAAVVAADPSSIVETVLRRILRAAARNSEVGQQQKLTAALHALAAARREAEPQASAAAAAPAAQSAPAPPRVCAAPGCGTTEGRLNRCAGCGSIRYCCEACQAAHWPAHRRQCRRVRAERAAVAEAAGGSSGAAAPSRA